MVDKVRFIIGLAGPAGCSKTPIASYLSYKFNLPVFNTDAIRSEVTEDLLIYNVNEYEKRRNKRLKEIIDRGISFILDASIDREWKNYKRLLEKENYKVFIISINISKKLLIKLYKAKIYSAFIDVDKWLADHSSFLDKYGQLVNLQITDANFKDRLKLSSEKLHKWLDSTLG